jgi:ribose transport system substrate-binding protein
MAMPCIVDVNSDRPRRRASRRGAHVVALALVGVSLIVAGCGGSDATGGTASEEQAKPASAGPLAQADADAKTHTAQITSFSQWSPGPSPKPKTNQTLGSVTCLWSVPACKRLADGVKAAAEAIGWEAKVVDGTPDPNNQRQALQTLLQQKVDALVMVSLDENNIGDLLKQAERAKIPWIGINMLRPEEFGAIDNVDVTGKLKSGQEGGRELAAWVASKSKGKAKVLMMSSTDNPGLQQRDKGFQDYLKDFPDIKFVSKTIYVPFRDLGAPLEAQVQSLMQRYPPGSIDYIYTPFDGFATSVVNGLQAAGRTDVKVLGFDGSPQNLDFIRGGRSQAASQATAWKWCAFTAVDELNRALSGESIPKKGCPGKVVDETNAPPKGQVFDGDLDVEAEFKKLWQGSGQ